MRWRDKGIGYEEGDGREEMRVADSAGEREEGWWILMDIYTQQI